MRGAEYFELSAFVAVLEQGSFHRAAEQLRLSPSALSQVIRGLERRVNARLLNRTTRSLSPTDAGARLLARIKPAFGEIDAAVTDLGNLAGSPTGTLRLHLPRLAARVFLEPLFGRFRSAYPDIVLDVTVDDALVNIVERGFDLGMRLTEELDNDVVALPVGPPMRYVAVAAPAYVAECGVPPSRRICWPTVASTGVSTAAGRGKVGVPQRAAHAFGRRRRNADRVGAQPRTFSSPAGCRHRFHRAATGGPFHRQWRTGGPPRRLVAAALLLERLLPQAASHAPTVRAFVDFINSVKKSTE